MLKQLTNKNYTHMNQLITKQSIEKMIAMMKMNVTPEQIL